MYTITSYDIVNGSKTQSREKNKPAPSLEYINRLQSRAERIFNCNRTHHVSVFINHKVPIEKHVKWV